MKIKKIIRNNLFMFGLIRKASPGRLRFCLLVVLLDSISSFLFDVYMIRYVINSIQTGRKFGDIIIFLLSIAAYNLCTCFIKNYYTERYAPVSDQKIYACIQKLIFQKAGSVELACFENPEFYDKYFKAVSEATGRASQMILSLSNTVNCVFTIASMSFVIFTIDPLLAVFAVLPLIATLLFGKKLNRYRYEYGMEMQEKTRKRTYINRVFYLGDFAKEMRVTNIGMVMFAKLKEAVRDLIETIRKHGFRLASLDYLFLAVNDIVVYLGAIAYAAYKTVVAKTMLYGDCVVVLNTINSVAWSLRSVTELYLEYDNHSMYIDNLRVFLEHESSVSENENGLQVIRGNCDIRLSGVSFRYTQSGPDVLKDINLHIPHNGKIALVGHNGAGKTTLVKLIMRLYDPPEGEITLNGEPVSRYRLGQYRSLFGTVFQDYQMFSLSVLENVLLKSHITSEERENAIKCLKESGIYPKISALKNGADTLLTKEFDENGAVLSTGEYQSVAFARVLARPCDIVILDEPSSFLDPEAEYAMYQNMLRAFADKTVIYISHRLSSAVLADRVILLENGSIAEEGTHSELLSKNGKYARMWKMQAEKYTGTTAV